MFDSNVNRIISILRDNSFDSEADHLEELSKQLSSGDESLRKKASLEIQGVCQVQSYGNLNIKTMNGWKWNTLLEKVAKHLSR